MLRPFLTEPQVAPGARQVLARFGLRPEDLDGLTARVDHAVLVELVLQSVRDTGDERLGLEGARILGTSLFHIIDYVGRASATILDALRMVERYHKLLHDGFWFRVEPGESHCTVAFGVEPGLELPPALADFCMASLFLTAYRMGLPPVNSRVCFAYPEPDTLDPYAEIFRVPVEFDAHEHHALLPAAAISMRLPEGDPVLLAVLEKHAERLLSRPSDSPPLAERTRRIVAEQLRAGEPRLARVAQLLSMSERTLRRKLILGGTTFKRIVDELRRDLALSYLEQGLGVEEIAFLLGFSEASALRRGFKRWVGRTLADHRREPPDDRQ